MSNSEKSDLRGYFSIRYLIPGYSFIIVFLLLNISPVVDFVTANDASELLGIILSFATLLSGSALGFLVSQLYWFSLNRQGGILAVNGFNKLTEVLETEYDYFPAEKMKDNIKIAGAIVDMSFYLEVADDKEKELLNYVWRRWDMYSTLYSTHAAIFVSAIIGTVLRMSFGFTSSQAFIIFYVPLLVIAVFIIIIKLTADHMIENYYPSFEAHIRHNLKKEELKEIFPQYFFKHCKYCKQKNVPNARFCNKCGKNFK